jgi:hypothetical protein
MTPKGLLNSLRAFQTRKPFKPFVVEFVDGDRVVVEHPEAVRYDGNGTAVHFGRRGEITLFDHDGVSKLTNVTPTTAGA